MSMSVLAGPNEPVGPTVDGERDQQAAFAGLGWRDGQELRVTDELAQHDVVGLEL
jgi:hypothetical protein